MATTQASDFPLCRLADELRRRHGQRVYKVALHTGLGCPNRDGRVARAGCSFCAQPALQPTGYRCGQSIESQLIEGMAYIRRRHHVERFIAYYQDYSGTYAPPDTLRGLWQPALATPEVVEIAVSTRPDCLPPAALELLQEFAQRKPIWVELGLQIADDALLAGLNRGHTVADFTAATHALHARSLRLCAHVIIGLPGASPQHEERTAALLAELGVWGVKLHAFHVLRGSKMAERHALQPLPLLDLDEHARRVVDFIERLPPAVVIHRITAEASRQLTVAPHWTLNKLAAHRRVLAEFQARGSRQGQRAAKTQQPKQKCRVRHY